uniref:Short neuropeptide F transcript variant X2 n=1 Tax=Galleria mellonella TaxID=7137 RepID=A0AA50IID5_GALME|nr:short neuropeptide F transcript variant X2 [Galleria mellonella]
MSRSCAFVLALCGFAAITTLPVSKAQALSSQYDTSAAAAESQSGWDALGGLYALLAQHDALGGHALARKSVRSPSRRLRFGRRSDPDMPPQAPNIITLLFIFEQSGNSGNMYPNIKHCTKAGG